MRQEGGGVTVVGQAIFNFFVSGLGDRTVHAAVSCVRLSVSECGGGGGGRSVPCSYFYRRNEAEPAPGTPDMEQIHPP